MKLFFRSLSVAAVLPALLFVVLGVGHAQEEEVVLVVGGDIEWSRITKAPGIAFDLEERSPGDWVRIPYLVTSETTPSLEAAFGRELSTPESHHVLAIHYGLEFDSVEEMIRYPLLRIAPVLRDADIAFANLETPLSDQARHSGAFRTPTAFADGLRWAGVDVVSTANNHALDADGQGAHHLVANAARPFRRSEGGRDLRRVSRKRLRVLRHRLNDLSRRRTPAIELHRTAARRQHRMTDGAGWLLSSEHVCPGTVLLVVLTWVAHSEMR